MMLHRYLNNICLRAYLQFNPISRGNAQLIRLSMQNGAREKIQRLIELCENKSVLLLPGSKVYALDLGQ